MASPRGRALAEEAGCPFSRLAPGTDSNIHLPFSATLNQSHTSLATQEPSGTSGNV